MEPLSIWGRNVRISCLALLEASSFSCWRRRSCKSLRRWMSQRFLRFSSASDFWCRFRKTLSSRFCNETKSVKQHIRTFRISLMKNGDGQKLEIRMWSTRILLIEKKKLSYVGHVMTNEGDCLEKEIMQGTVPGARKTKIRWIDNMDKWVEMSFHKLLREAGHRRRWNIIKQPTHRMRIKTRQVTGLKAQQNLKLIYHFSSYQGNERQQ